MSEVIKVRRCYGCGVILQADHPNEVGYVPEKHLHQHEVVLCQRCFKLQHYNQDILQEPVVDSNFLTLINRIRDTKSLIVYIVDLFSFETSFNHQITEAIKGFPIILVGNKIDLLPKSTPDEKLLTYLKNRSEQAGLTVDKFILLSSTKRYNIDELLDAIMELRHGKDVYVLGAVSSGKSSMINTLLKVYQNETKNFITTSIYPNTTLKVIEIPLDDKTFIFDTPGLSISNSLVSKVEKEVLRLIVPKVEIKPKVHQLNEGQSLFFGGIGRFDFVKGKRTGFTVYCSEGVQMHRTPLVRATQTFDSMVKGRKLKPISKLVQSNLDLDVYEVKIDTEEKIDIGITGLGWIAFKGNQQVIRVHVPKGVSFYQLPSKL